MISAPLRFALVLCGLIAWPAVAAEERGANPFGKIEATAKSSLERDYRKVFRAWCQRVLVEPAKARLAGKEYEAEALKYIDDVMEVYGEDEACRMPEQLRDVAPKLEKAGCKDPLVCYLGAHVAVAVYGADRDHDWSDHFLREAAKAVESAEGPLGALVLWELVAKRLKLQESREQLEAKAAKWMLEALADRKTYVGDEIQVFLRQLDTGLGNSHLRRAHPDFAPFFQDAKKWAAAGQPEWARLTLMGYLEARRATTTHVTGVAAVADAGWQEWARHIRTAHSVLEEAWKLRPDLPYAAAEMIIIALVLPNEKDQTPKLWFDRAIAAQFDYGPAYRFLLYANRPRWQGGSYDRMLAIGAACMDSGRYDTIVPGFFAMACENIAEELKEEWPRLYREQPEVTRRLVEMHRKYAAEPSREALRWHDRSQLAVAAWLVGDAAAAEEALAAAGPRLHRCALTTLRRYDRDGPDLRSEIAILRSPAAESFNAGDLALAYGEFDKALPLFRKALEAAPKKNRGLVQERLTRVLLGQEFAKGEWVKLPVHKGLALWRQVSGRWECKEDGVLSCGGLNDTNLIVFAQPPGGNFEFRAEFANPPGGEKAGMPSSGLVLGYRDYEDRDWLSAYIYKRRTGGREIMAQLRKRWGTMGVPEKPVELKEWNKLDVILSNGRVTFIVNGEAVLVQSEPPKGDAEGVQGMVGFTAFNQSAGTVLTIRNVELRQLP